MNIKQCETCEKPAVKGERFCKECRKARLAEMAERRDMTTKETRLKIERLEVTAGRKFSEDERDAIRRECGWTEAEIAEGAKDGPLLVLPWYDSYTVDGILYSSPTEADQVRRGLGTLPIC